MNETLDGHSGEISSITWNDKFNKLTTADSNGKIVVWVNYEGQWCEEMVNKRDNTTVTGMKWSPDGLHICIIYNDGKCIAKFCSSRLTFLFKNSMKFRSDYNGFTGRYTNMGEGDQKRHFNQYRGSYSKCLIFK